MLGDSYGPNDPMRFVKILLGPESSRDISAALPDFQIERRAGLPYSANRYFVTAPLKTESHIFLLKRFEDLLE